MGLARLGVFFACAGCASSASVTRVMSAEEAIAVQSPTFKPAAILRDGDRLPVATDGDVVVQKGDQIEMKGDFAANDAIPGGGHVESSRPVGALIAGLTLFAMSYAPAAYAASQTNDKWLYAPVVGPWIDLATRPACSAAGTTTVNGITVALPVDPCLGDNVAKAVIIASGAIQGLGALITLIALPAHAHVVEKKFAIVPTGLGAAAFGTF